MRVTLRLVAPPETFVNRVERYTKKPTSRLYRAKAYDGYPCGVDTLRRQDEGRRFLLIIGRSIGGISWLYGTLARLEVEPIDNERIEVSIECEEEEEESAIEYYYDLLEAIAEDYLGAQEQLEKQGIKLPTSAPEAAVPLEQPQSAAQSATRREGGATKGSGGRPRNPDDDWAYQQVRELGRKPAEVYPEWLNRIGKRAKELADPYDSFKKAIKPSRGKNKKR